MANENKMGYLPIKKLILQMSLPPMCSMFLQYSYNLVDSMFVANINENALAAVSLSFPITTLMISLSIWIGVGINVLIAGYLGEKEQGPGFRRFRLQAPESRFPTIRTNPLCPIPWCSCNWKPYKTCAMALI